MSPVEWVVRRIISGNCMLLLLVGEFMLAGMVLLKMYFWKSLGWTLFVSLFKLNWEMLVKDVQMISPCGLIVCGPTFVERHRDNK